MDAVVAVPVVLAQVWRRNLQALKRLVEDGRGPADDGAG